MWGKNAQKRVTEKGNRKKEKWKCLMGEKQENNWEKKPKFMERRKRKKNWMEEESKKKWWKEGREK